MLHTFSLNGFNIGVDSNSANIMILDDISYELLNEFNIPFTYEQALKSF